MLRRNCIRWLHPVYVTSYVIKFNLNQTTCTIPRSEAGYRIVGFIVDGTYLSRCAGVFLAPLDSRGAVFQ